MPFFHLLQISPLRRTRSQPARGRYRSIYVTVLGGQEQPEGGAPRAVIDQLEPAGHAPEPLLKPFEETPTRLPEPPQNRKSTTSSTGRNSLPPKEDPERIHPSIAPGHPPIGSCSAGPDANRCKPQGNVYQDQLSEFAGADPQARLLGDFCRIARPERL